MLAFLFALRAAQSLDLVALRLSHVGIFAFGGIGFAGTTTQGEKDYRAILSRPSAKSDFEKVFASGSAEAKLYALVALQKLDSDAFKSLASPLRSSGDQIHTGIGCVLTSRPVGEMVKMIEGGQYGKP